MAPSPQARAPSRHGDLGSAHPFRIAGHVDRGDAAVVAEGKADQQHELAGPGRHDDARPPIEQREPHRTRELELSGRIDARGAAPVAWIALCNLFNRINVATGQVAAGEQWG